MLAAQTCKMNFCARSDRFCPLPKRRDELKQVAAKTGSDWLAPATATERGTEQVGGGKAAGTQHGLAAAQTPLLTS